MLSFTPQTKPRTAFLFSASCAASGMILYALSSYIAHAFTLLPILSLALIAIGIWFLYRFGLLSYRYEIRDHVLCVHRRLFRTERTVYTLSLHMAFAAVDADDTTTRKRIGKAYRVHNFLSVWPSEQAVVIYYRDAGRLCAVMLENNPAFTAAAAQHFSEND